MNRPRQPRSKPVGIAAIRQPLPDPEDGILADIFGPVNVAHDRTRHGQAGTRMPRDKHTESMVIAGASAGEKGGIRAWIGLQRRRPPAT